MKNLQNNFTTPEQPKDKCGSIANYAWYIFQKGYKGQSTIYWL